MTVWGNMLKLVHTHTPDTRGHTGPLPGHITNSRRLTHLCPLLAYSSNEHMKGEGHILKHTGTGWDSTHNRSFRNSEIRKSSPRATPRHGPQRNAVREEQRRGGLSGKRACSAQLVTCPSLAPLLHALWREGHEDGLFLLPLLRPVLHRLPHEAARHERVLKLHPLGVRG